MQKEFLTVKELYRQKEEYGAIEGHLGVQYHGTKNDESLVVCN